MRDDNDYHRMSRADLRLHLERVSKEIAVWSYASSVQRREENLYYLDGYKNSNARAVTERKMEAEMNAGHLTREAIEAEGYVAFYTPIRDLIVELLHQPDIDDLILET